MIIPSFAPILASSLPEVHPMRGICEAVNSLECGEVEFAMMLDYIQENALLEGSDPMAQSFFEVGECYIIRSVTMYWVGRVKEVQLGFLVMEGGGWIAHTARWHDCLEKGDLREFEPMPDPYLVNTQMIVDATRWRHPLPGKPI